MQEHPVYYSIVIPTYNREKLIGRAIDSVLAQTYPYFELIVSDDASTDGTESVVRSYKDERIRYIKATVNKGNAATRNAGVKASSHAFIAFLDSDDTYKVNYLEKLHHACLKMDDSTGMLWTGVVTVDEEYHVLGEGYWDPGEQHKGPYQFFYNLKMGTNCGFAVRRNYFDAVNGFDEQLRAAVDTDFLLRLGKICNYIVIPENLVYYQFATGVDSVRKNRIHQSKAYDLIVQKHGDVWAQSAYLKNKWYYKAFWLSYYAKEKKNARRYFRQMPFSNKTFFVFLLFELLPHRLAVKLHGKLSNKGFSGYKRILTDVSQ